MEGTKERIARYWGQRSQGFRDAHRGEWESPAAAAYREAILPHLSGEKPAILDIGTGSGFFPLLLGDQAVEITGIDLTEEMVEAAAAAAREEGIPARFLQMDGEALTFESGSFDLILTRNLTWNLPHLERAYKEWLRVLRPGGVLLNFDGDYVESDWNRSPQELDSFHASQPITGEMQAQYRAILKELLPQHRPRPQWDVELLRQVGFGRVEVEEPFGGQFGPTQLFCITAYKNF